MNTAHATTFSPIPFRQLIPQVDAFVVGRVGSKKTEWAEMGGGRQIVTVMELAVQEWIRRPEGATPGSTIRIREIGGEKDGIGLSIPGSAQFEEGETVLLALTPLSVERGEFRVKGMSLGKYDLERDANGNVVQFFTAGENNSREMWTLTQLRDAVKVSEASEEKKEFPNKQAEKASNPEKKEPEITAPLSGSTEVVETPASTLLYPQSGGEVRGVKGLFVLIAIVGTVVVLRALFRKR